MVENFKEVAKSSIIEFSDNVRKKIINPFVNNLPCVIKEINSSACSSDLWSDVGAGYFLKFVKEQGGIEIKKSSYDDIR